MALVGAFARDWSAAWSGASITCAFHAAQVRGGARGQERLVGVEHGFVRLVWNRREDVAFSVGWIGEESKGFIAVRSEDHVIERV